MMRADKAEVRAMIDKAINPLAAKIAELENELAKQPEVKTDAKTDKKSEVKTDAKL